MRLHNILATAGIALIASAATASAQTQSVTFEVAAINELSFTGAPSLTINSATAGSAPTSATASGTYAVSTNETNRKISAKINIAMPSGVKLLVTVAAPTGGSSVSNVDLGITDQNVVTAISTLNESGLAVDYTLTATSAAGVVASSSRTVTYTITAGV